MIAERDITNEADVTVVAEQQPQPKSTREAVLLALSKPQIIHMLDAVEYEARAHLRTIRDCIVVIAILVALLVVAGVRLAVGG